MFINSLTLIFLIKAVYGLYVDDFCVLNHDGSPGICKLEGQCQIAKDMLKYNRIRPTVCGFSGQEPVLCCPTGKFQVNNGNIKGANQISKRISVKKCNEYRKCGRYRGKRDTKLEFHITVVGGEDASPGEYPHMAAIGWTLADRSGYAWYCGGSLISDNFVMTAAHCTFVRDSNVLSSEPTIVKLGQNYLNEEDVTAYQHIEIDRIIRHPNYTAIVKYNDIALLKLKKTPVFGDFIRPSCLWQTENIPKQKSIATGWGKLGFTEPPSDYLQKVFIDVIEPEACQKFYTTKRSLPRGIIKEQLCAGDLNGGKDTCQGDSGGPLQIIDPEKLCTLHVIGITSFGVGCGGENSPAVYTRVSSYIDWIESIVWPNE